MPGLGIARVRPFSLDRKMQLGRGDRDIVGAAIARPRVSVELTCMPFSGPRTASEGGDPDARSGDAAIGPAQDSGRIAQPDRERPGSRRLELDRARPGCRSRARPENRMPPGDGDSADPTGQSTSIEPTSELAWMSSVTLLPSNASIECIRRGRGGQLRVSRRLNPAG